MPYILNTPQDQQAMLQAIGMKSLDELFDHIPAQLRLNRALNVPRALTELELTGHMKQLGGKNVACDQRPCFLGAGSYDHFIPAVVDVISSRGEFYTSYTPYQAEASQGNLQAFFEYQTLITQLTGMDVSNASLYEGGTATIEAVLMSMTSTKRLGRVVTLGSVHPEYRQVMATYLHNLGVELVTIRTPDGICPLDQLESAVNDQTACVMVQHPNFFGCLEDTQAIGEIANKAGAMFAVSVDPISLGMLKRPGDYGADIVVGEGQSLGSPMAYGGPYLGILACRESLVRKMPGRLVGQTVDRRGNRCWALTLQTREQHIRRDKATSNICTNQGLYALRASVYLSLLGPQGLHEVAELCLRKSHYAQEVLTAAGLKPVLHQPIFKEFALRVPGGNVPQFLARLGDAGYHAGVDLGRWYPELHDCFLLAVTEKRTRDEIDGLAQAVRQVLT